MVIIKDGVVYNKAPFRDEKELQRLVEAYRKVFFGENSIYIPISGGFYVKTPGGKGVQPDGLVFNLSARKWYIVEVELRRHSVWGHIIPQALELLMAFMNTEERQKIKALLREEILRGVSSEKSLGEHVGEYARMEKVLEETLKCDPHLVIIIDGVPQDLESLTQFLKAHVPVSIIVVEKYESEDGDVIYQVSDSISEISEPLEEGMERPGGKIISREEFLSRSTPAIRLLYEGAEELARKYPGLVKLEHRQQGVSLRLRVSPQGEYRVLFTVYPDAFYIIKMNMDSFSEYYGPENVRKFLDKLKSIRAIYMNYDLMAQPKVSGTELVDDEAKAIISALEELLASRSNRQEEG